MQSESKDSSNLDFLRTIAVSCVFIAHFRHFAFDAFGLFEWHLGQLGVLMFFVHTSLVLMMSLERMRFNHWRLFVSFYVRRLFRIYPLSIACLLILYFTRFQPEVGRPSQLFTLPELLANITLTQNLFYIDDMLRVLWSLPIEVQMYLFLPFLFLMARSVRSRLLFALWFLSVGFAILQPHVSGRLNVLSFAPCFVPGVIAWRLISKETRKLPGVFWPLAVLVLSGIWFSSSRENEMYFRWTFCLALGLAIPVFSEIPFKWLNSASKVIAKYSYGVYLTHLFTMAIAFKFVLNPMGQFVVFVALSFLFPYIAYQLIEHPGIQAGRKIATILERKAYRTAIVDSAG